MGCDCVIIAGASTDNTVLWTSGDAFQYRYGVVVVEDCTIVHHEAPGAKEAALTIIRRLGEVLSLDETINKYLQPR
jgi:nicotinamidase-related amidase